MADPARASATRAEEPTGSVSVVLVVLTALLIGVGLLGTAYWLITFKWLYFLGLVPLSAGAFLLFTRATGGDHA